MSFTVSPNLLKLMSIESVVPSDHLILFPFSFCPQSFPASGSFLRSLLLWPDYWSFSFSISPSSEYSGLISFRIDWFDLLEVQEILRSLLQHHNSKASILCCSAVLMIQLPHPYMTTGKNHSFNYMDLCQQSDVSAF